MMKIKLALSTLCLLVCTVVSLSAQVLGIVKYQQKFAEDVLHLHKESMLYFGANSSKYIYNVSLENISEFNQGQMFIQKENANEIGDVVYYDKKENELLLSLFLNTSSTRYSVTDDAKMNWNVTGKSKKIGVYNCREAKTEFRGRSYTVYFTPEIPVNYGPWKFRGLPGLILEVADSKNEVSFFATDINLSPSPKQQKKVSLDFDYKGKKMSMAEYEAEKLEAVQKWIKYMRSKTSGMEGNITIEYSGPASKSMITEKSFD